MPINRNTRRKNHLTGSSKDTHGELIVAVFGFIGLHEMRSVFEQENPEGSPRRRGRKSVYPPTALLAVLACARVTGSLTSAVALLHADTDLWCKCTAAFADRSGVQLPPVPPTRDQVTHFRDQLAGNAGLMAAAQNRFRRLAVGQARLQGNLLSGVAPDFAKPLECHSIYGDGTVIAKFSEVREFTDPQTGKVVVLGSRAKGRGSARIQRTTSDTSEDLKDTNGLNMVAMHTWTSSGRITLGTGVALGGEVWAALEIIESLHELAGDGIHSVIYDRAITGAHCDHLMANHRIQVIGKAVGASSPRADREHQDPAWKRASDNHLKEVVDRRLAEHGLTPGTDAAFIVRRHVLADMLRYHDRMPLGLSIYPTSNRNFDLVRSVHHELEPVTHAGQDGTCVHRIALDDGGLFEIDDNPDGEGQLVKTRVLRCQESTPFQRADGRWGRSNRYLITCPHGNVETVHTWLPEGVRRTPGSAGSSRAPKDRIGWRLRPLSRADDIAAWYNETGDTDHFASPRPFSDVYSRRNDAESYNEWYQQSLPHHGRAASMDPAAQELDFLLAALLNNCITWTNRR